MNGITCHCRGTEATYRETAALGFLVVYLYSVSYPWCWIFFEDMTNICEKKDPALRSRLGSTKVCKSLQEYEVL